MTRDHRLGGAQTLAPITCRGFSKRLFGPLKVEANQSREACPDRRVPTARSLGSRAAVGHFGGRCFAWVEEIREPGEIWVAGAYLRRRLINRAMEIRQFASDHLPISFQPGSGRAANEGLPCGQPQSTLFGYLVPEGTLTTTTQHLLVILAVMPDVIPTTEAATRIGVTPQTIRNLIAAGELQGTSKPWGKKRRLRYVEVESLDRYCEEASNAAAPKRRRIDRLEEEVRRIAEVVDGSPDITGPSTAQLEKISSLQDAMARLRDVIPADRTSPE